MNLIWTLWWIGLLVSAQAGKLFKGSKSTEEIEFQRLTFLRDTTVSIGLTMVVFF